MKNKKLLLILGIIVVIAVSMGAYGVSNYNSLVAQEESVKKFSSDIDADLQRRTDLIPNLVNTVQGYASHEKDVLDNVSNARSQMISAGTTGEKAEADAKVTSALGRLFSLTENYPDLKANQGFKDLQTQLEGTENRIKVARTKYNEAAQGFNTLIRKFPTSFFASTFGFHAFDYFQAKEGADQVPEVNFGK